jgi:hypothetical protein
MRLNERCRHHKRPEVALDSRTLKEPELVQAATGQKTSLRIHETYLEKMTSRKNARRPTELPGVGSSFLYFPRRIWLLVYVRQISGNRTSPSTFTKCLTFAEFPNERRNPPKTFCGAQPFRFCNSGQSCCDLKCDCGVLLADGECVITGTSLSDQPEIPVGARRPRLTTWLGISRDRGYSVDLYNGCVLRKRP